MTDSELRTEVMDECLEWLIDNPGAERLPHHLFEHLSRVGLNALKAESRLLMDRDRQNN